MALHPSLQSRKQAGVADAILLEAGRDGVVTEDTFLSNLEQRFKNDIIYTYIGSVVLSVNPFKGMPGLYENEAIKMYRGKYYYEVPPHIFALTDDAYRNQCIIISGESGAGKTEASKLIMQYIASVSSSSNEVDRIKDVLLKSNPILEAFGNAKTNRNNNSSRFGKYMDIQFNYKGDPIGGHINNYLLEKSRVVRQNKGERGFHVMYFLMDAKIDYLKLTKPDDFAYLNGGTHKINGMNDKHQFDQMQAALSTVGFSKEESTTLYKIAASILHLGNIEFEVKADGSIVKGTKHAQIIADLLGVKVDALSKALTLRTVNAQKELVQTQQNPEQAAYARDSLAKGLYSKMFDFIVGKINSKIEQNQPSLLIGVLDIYGFEVFQQSNGFEQFCINYCNEKLQQIFIELTLKSEQEEYAKEGIEWTHIEYFNNAVILELIESTKNGIIATLDEECLRPGATSDQTFLEKLNERHKQRSGASEHFESKFLVRTDKQLNHEQFRLKHYAGSVTYDIAGFMDKNMDLLSRDLKQLVAGSSNSLISHLYPTEDSSTKRMVTTAITFKQSLNELVQSLLSKNPHYVRCIKSNDQLSPGTFNSELVRHQARYLGLLENVRVRRAGFVFRMPYDKFIARYRILSPKTWPKYAGSNKEASDVVMKDLRVASGEYKLGKSKIFIRKPNTIFKMEEERERELPKCATLIAKVWRGYIQRKKFKRLVSAVKISLFYKKMKFKKYFLDLNKTFKDVKQRKDLGKTLIWPRAPPALHQGAIYIRQIWRRWAALQLIKMLPADQVEKVKIKVNVFSLLSKKKPYNASRIYVGEYLGTEASKYRGKYEQFKRKTSGIVYSDIVQKCSRAGKGATRLLVLTKTNLTILHENFSSKKAPIALSSIKAAWATNKRDSLLVLKTGELDLILDFSPAIGDLAEFLGRLYDLSKFQMNVVDGGIEAQTAKGKYLTMSEKGQAAPNGAAQFKLLRNKIIAYYQEV